MLYSQLEKMTVAAGGRIYFAKDALAQGQDMAQMYPELNDWRKQVNKFDPEGQMMTDLVRRLGLRGA